MKNYRRYPEYKDSGIEWLGEIPAHWEVVPYKTILSRNDSGVWGDDPDGASDSIVLRSTEQSVDGAWQIDDPATRRLTARDRHEALLREGDLVVTKSSGSKLHIGKTSYVNAEVASLQACFSNFMQRLRLKAGNTPRLYWYFMNSPACRQQLVFLSSTTTGLGNLNGEIIGAVRVPVPPDDEQHSIADFLDRETAKIDALIEKKERLIELLKEKRTALISHAVTKGLDPNVPIKDSGIEWLGKIPAHWKVVRVKNIAAMRAGTAITSEAIEESGQYPVFGGNGLRGYTSSFTHEGVFVLVGRQGALCGNINYASGKFWASEHAVVVTPLGGTNPYWLGETLRSMRLNQYSVAAAQPGLAVDRILALSVALPPNDEQRHIADFLDRETAKIDVLIKKIEEAIKLLKEYRTALISAAVTGKIDVREELEQKTEDSKLVDRATLS